MADRMIPVARPRPVELWHGAPLPPAAPDEDWVIAVAANSPRSASRRDLREIPLD